MSILCIWDKFHFQKVGLVVDCAIKKCCLAAIRNTPTIATLKLHQSCIHNMNLWPDHGKGPKFSWSLFPMHFWTYFLASFLSLSKKKPHTFKNWSLIETPQFLSNPHETWKKWLTHKAIIFPKFHEDWKKIVDFLLQWCAIEFLHL